MTRYPKNMVLLHWLLAFMILGALFGGTVLLEPKANTDPGKLVSLRLHVSLATAILVLMLIRVAVRLRSRTPPAADIGHPVLNRAAPWVHFGLYLLTFAMLGTGIATAIASGLPGILLGPSDAPLPESFDIFTARLAHGIFAKLLILLIAAHIAAALWHQFIRKDALLARMSFGGKE